MTIPKVTASWYITPMKPRVLTVAMGASHADVTVAIIEAGIPLIRRMANRSGQPADGMMAIPYVTAPNIPQTMTSHLGPTLSIRKLHEKEPMVQPISYAAVSSDVMYDSIVPPSYSWFV